jgi:arylsulfatase A-like enzyme
MGKVKKRPNILHVFTDQQRWDTIGALGNTTIKTPNLDRLTNDGVSFINCYSPSPVCVAARAAMIHGQFAHHTGCYENTLMPIDGRDTLMSGLASSGYRTHSVGKCHFTPDLHALKGFQSREVFEAHPVTAADLERNPYLSFLSSCGYDYVMEPYGTRSEMYYIPQVSLLPQKHHHSQWITDRAISFISRRDDAAPEYPGASLNGPPDPGQPWYLFVGFLDPHPPFAPPTPWNKLYRSWDMPIPLVPDGWEQLLTLINHIQNRYKYRDRGIDRHLLAVMKAYYYASISFVDFQVGRLLEALAAAGELDDTLIIFSSDHGEMLGDFNSFGKRSMHDSSCRVPMILRWPGHFFGGRRVSQVASLVDIAPTILGAANAGISSHELDGVDLAEIVRGACSREHVFAQVAIDESPYCKDMTLAAEDDGNSYSSQELRSRFSTYMAVSEKSKYVYSAMDGTEFVFDRRTDPFETRNLLCDHVISGEPLVLRSALIEELRRSGETGGLVAPSYKTWRTFPPLHINPDPNVGLIVQDFYTPWTDQEILYYTG